jgi:hypothetical protein
MQHFVSLSLVLFLLVLAGCGSDAPAPGGDSPEGSTATAEQGASPAEPAAVDSSVIFGMWGIGDDGVKAAMEAMKAQAGDSEEALASIAMMEPMMRETMGMMMVEIAKDAVINYSPKGEERAAIESMTNEGNRFTLTVDGQAMELEWRDPVLLLWVQGQEASKMTLSRLSDDEVKNVQGKIAAKKAAAAAAASSPKAPAK